MFSIEQIMLAHSKVKTGEDFPQYAEEIKQLGVTYYETYVVDGHTDFFGANSYRITSPAKYPDQAISTECNTDAFKLDLMSHQRGETDYLTFIRASAEFGIEKWAVCMDKMTCMYFDKAGNKVLVEQIPQVSTTGN